MEIEVGSGERMCIKIYIPKIGITPRVAGEKKENQACMQRYVRVHVHGWSNKKRASWMFRILQEASSVSSAQQS
jgi:hypothetical protein